MHFDYDLDRHPPLWQLLLFGLQWAAITIPLIIVLGRVAAAIHHTEPSSQLVYLQKLFFVTAGTLLVQVLWGHRLPIVTGPATILLIGVTAGRGSSTEAIYLSVALGGLLLALLAATGILGPLQKLFTSRVVATVLLLLAFTLAPSILGLLFDTGGAISPLAGFLFSLVMLTSMFLLQRTLRGVWKSTVIFWSILVGTAAYLLLFPSTAAQTLYSGGPVVSGFLEGLVTELRLDPGVLLSFLFCYLALAINDVGSIQSTAELIGTSGIGGRLRRGVAFTGLANILSGFLGVVGPVNYSISAGVIASTRCASRFTLVPAAILVGLLAFIPAVVGIISSIPSVIIGCVLFFILTSQIAAGLIVAFDCAKDGNLLYESAVVIGFPVLLGTVVAFLPGELLGTFPVVLRPILGNGFVVGVVAAFVLEHLIIRPSNPRP
jgi:xanthine/uracil permease